MIALIFDTETTGFPNASNPPEIVQIGAILQEFPSKRVLGELNLICKTSAPIPQACIDIHNITDELSQTIGIDPRIADNMFGLLAAKADLLVAHNMDFDAAIIDGAWEVSRNIVKSKQQFCTMRECRIFPDIPRKHAGRTEFAKLSDCYRYFYGEDFENAHDAMADVRACRDVYLGIVRKLGGLVNESP